MKYISLICALGIIPAAVASNEHGPCDLLLYNGTILTFDDKGTTASAIEITGNIITAMWLEDPAKSNCTQSIDLAGRTVIPGLIDNHVHWLARAYRPGHNVAEMDNAFSWQEAVEILLRKMSEVPEVAKGQNATADNFITAIGGITPTQFIEGVLPDLATLDGIDRPVFLSPGFNGPSQTNTEGIAYFQAHGVTVAANGSITTGNTTAARNALSSEHNFDDQVRGTLDLMAWSASVGLTTVMNFSDNSSAAETLFDDGTAFTRLRHNLGSQSLAQVPNIIQQLLESNGNDMFRLVLLGEFVVGGQGVPSDYDDAALLMAEAGVSHHQHAIPNGDASGFLDVWEAVNHSFPVTDLRWQLAHVFNMSANTMNRLDALGGGFAMQTQNYAGTLLFTDDGPPFRSVYDHAALRASTGTDGGNLVTINPWLAIYFMTTGLNDAGAMRIPPGETITVTEAIELYTSAASWFSFDEAKLGSLEVGKLADLAVLSEDVLALETQGNYAELRNVTSLLTIVDGDIVYSDGTLVKCADSDEYGVWYRQAGDSICVFSNCETDLDGDGSVGTSDLLELFAQWGTAGSADFDGSGIVNTTDLLILFANWGSCG
ncbi:MAG: amidohydrolase family protein [Planctomycetes bacterium]|nr:amidohydrolase family protein [Planctomycetota bacterium]